MVINNLNQNEEINKDVERIGERVKIVKEKPEFNLEKKKEDFEKIERTKEIVKQSMKELVDEEPQLESVDNQHSDSNGITEDEYLADYLKTGEVEEQVKGTIEFLLQLVVDKGIFIALRKSKKYPPFIQDAFHDSLVDKLLPELKEKNII